MNSVFKDKVKGVYQQWVTNEYLNSGDGSQAVMKTNKDSKEQLFGWVQQGWSLTDTATVLSWLARSSFVEGLGCGSTI